MLMPATWVELLIALLFLPPGILYSAARARVLKRAEMESTLTDKNWLDVIIRLMFIGVWLEVLAALMVVLSLWLLIWLSHKRSWLGSPPFDISLPTSEAFSSEQWDNVRDYVRDYSRSHWQLVGIAAIATYVVAMLLGPVMGRRRGQRTVDEEEIQRQADAVSAIRSHAMIRLKNGTVYSGDLPGHPTREPVLGKEELVLIAPINVRINGLKRTLPSESLAVASSEIASLALDDGKQNRLFLYSDAVPPPWLRS
jgi:hypothetical protein